MKKFKNIFGGKKDKNDRKDDKATPYLRTRHSVADGLSSYDRYVPHESAPSNLSQYPFPPTSISAQNPSRIFQTPTTVPVTKPSTESNQQPRPVASIGYSSPFLGTERQIGGARGRAVSMGIGTEGSAQKSKAVARSSPPHDTTSTARKIAESTAKPPTLLTGERKQNTPLKRREVGALPTSQRVSSAAKGQDKACDKRDSGSTISIGKNESSDSDSDLDIGDLIDVLMTSRSGAGPSGRDSPDSIGPMGALLLGTILARRRIAEMEKSSTEGKKATTEGQSFPAAQSRSKPQDSIAAEKTASTETPVTSRATPTQSAAKKSAWPPPASAPKFKVPVLAAQKGAIATPALPETASKEPNKEITTSPTQQPTSARRIAQPRRSLIQRAVDSDAHGNSRPAASVPNPITSSSQAKPTIAKATTTAAYYPTVPEPPERAPSPSLEGTAGARKLHEQRVAGFRAAAAARRQEGSPSRNDQDRVSALPPPAWNNPLLRSSYQDIDKPILPPPTRNNPSLGSSRPGVFPPMARAFGKGPQQAPRSFTPLVEKKQQAPVQTSGPKFKVPVLSESEKAALALKASRAAASARGFDGWD